METTITTGQPYLKTCVVCVCMFADGVHGLNTVVVCVCVCL